MQDRCCTFARPNCGETGFFSFASGALFLLADSADDLLRLTPLAHLTVALHVHGRTPCRAEQGKEEDLAVVVYAGQPCVLSGAYMNTTTTNKSVIATVGVQQASPYQAGGEGKPEPGVVGLLAGAVEAEIGRGAVVARLAGLLAPADEGVAHKAVAPRIKHGGTHRRLARNPVCSRGKTLKGQSDKKNNNSQTLRHADTHSRNRSDRYCPARVWAANRAPPTGITATYRRGQRAQHAW